MGTHPIFESDFDCLTELRKMFRLSKGNQSRKNHKIINQTTKVSDTDTKLSTPAIQAQQHQLEEQARLEQERKQLELLEQQKLEKQIEVEKIESCAEEVQKMTINSVENENLRYRAENESLKGQLINVTPQFPIQEKIRM